MRKKQRKPHVEIDPRNIVCQGQPTRSCVLVKQQPILVKRPDKMVFDLNVNVADERNGLDWEKALSKLHGSVEAATFKPNRWDIRHGGYRLKDGTYQKDRSKDAVIKEEYVIPLLNPQLNSYQADLPKLESVSSDRICTSYIRALTSKTDAQAWLREMQAQLHDTHDQLHKVNVRLEKEIGKRHAAEKTNEENETAISELQKKLKAEKARCDDLTIEVAGVKESLEAARLNEDPIVKDIKAVPIIQDSTPPLTEQKFNKSSIRNKDNPGETIRMQKKIRRKRACTVCSTPFLQNRCLALYSTKLVHPRDRIQFDNCQVWDV